MSSVISKLFGGKPKAPPVFPATTRISETSGIYARDELLRRLSRLRAANVRTSELSAPNVKRKVLGTVV